MKIFMASVVAAVTILMTSISYAEEATNNASSGATQAVPENNAQAAPSDNAKANRFDKNGDGVIERDEFGSLDRMKAADTNNDGVLSDDEIQAFVLKRLVERQANRLEHRLDADGDGKVTLDEIQKQDDKRFAALDTNNDGKLEKSELRHGRHFHRGHHHRHHAGNKHFGRHHHHHKHHDNNGSTKL